MGLSIRKATKQDVKIMARIHLDSFEGFFMSKLGYGFLKVYYRSCLNIKGTICFIAANDSGKVVGFVIGSQKAMGYNKKVLMSNIFRMGFAGLAVLFKNPKDLIRLAKNMTKKSDNQEVEDEQNYAQIELIGIVKEYQSKGIGFKLFSAFENELLSLNINYLSLTTDKENNKNTLSAYSRWGFEEMYEFVSYPNRKMYRLIKQVK